MNDSEQILMLISSYIDAVRRTVGALRRELAQEDLLQAVNTGVIPREGTLSDGASYSFHGTGCSVEDDAMAMDFDFGPEGRCDGFDAWRLWHFALERPDLAVFHDRAVIDRALARLSDEGMIECLGSPPSPHLFYLCKS